MDNELATKPNESEETAPEADKLPMAVEVQAIPDNISRAPEEIIRDFDANSDIKPIPKEKAQVFKHTHIHSIQTLVATYLRCLTSCT